MYHLRKLNPEYNFDNSGYRQFKERKMAEGGKYIPQHINGAECEPWMPCYQNKRMGIPEVSREPAPFMPPPVSDDLVGYQPPMIGEAPVTQEPIITEENTPRKKVEVLSAGLTPEKIEKFNPKDNLSAPNIPKNYLEETSRKKEEIDYNIFNQYAGVDIPTAAYALGQSIENKDTLGTVSSGLKLVAGLGRNVVGGMGYQNRYNQELKNAQDKLKKTKNQTQFYENGGYLQSLANGGKKEREMATGEFMQGVENTNTQPYNAEVEAGEYFQTNQGDIAEIVGKKHSQGGEKIQMEQEDRVLSDKLKIGAKVAKELSEKYGLKLKAKDTYSTVLDKYKKKSKLNKIIDEEAVILDKIDKQKKVSDTATRDFNLDVLAKKKMEIEDKKHPIEEQRKAMFDELFDIQEESKTGKNKTKNNFELGGKLESLAKEYGIPLERAKELVQSFAPGGKLGAIELEECEDGDEACHERNRILRSKTNPNIENYQAGEHQHFTGDAFAGDVNESNYKDKMLNLFDQFPVIVQQNFNVVQGANGIIDFVPKNGTTKQAVANLQKDINGRYNQVVEEIKAKVKDPSKQEELINQVKNEMFLDTEKNRKNDGILGDFTASRKNFSLNQLLSKTQPNNLLPNNPDEDNLILETFDTEEKERLKNSAGVFLFPDESPLMPSALQGTLKNEARFNRVTPNEIAIEPYLQDIKNREQTQVQSTEWMSPNVRAAYLQNIRANSQNQESKIRNQIDTQNLASLEKAEYENARIGTREGLQQNNYNSRYENRIYTAQAKTDFDLQNYYNKLQDLNATRFEDINTLNLTNARSEDIYFDGQNFRRKAGSSDEELFDKATNRYRNS